jgi:hypothetical protein
VKESWSEAFKALANKLARWPTWQSFRGSRTDPNYLDHLASRKIEERQSGSNQTDSPQDHPDYYLCCGEQVNIAFRGISDDRLYLSYNRTWSEVAFFKPNGLRVYCAVCRRRIYRSLK